MQVEEEVILFGKKKRERQKRERREERKSGENLETRKGRIDEKVRENKKNVDGKLDRGRQIECRIEGINALINCTRVPRIFGLQLLLLLRVSHKQAILQNAFVDLIVKA